MEYRVWTETAKCKERIRKKKQLLTWMSGVQWHRSTYSKSIFVPSGLIFYLGYLAVVMLINISNFSLRDVTNFFIVFTPSIYPAPKNSECKNPLENFSPRFFGIKTASSSLIIFQRAKISTRSINHLWWCNWRTFWRQKRRRGKVTKVVFFLHDNAPTYRALATQKKLAYLSFQCLDHAPYSPDLAPSDYHLFPGLKKQLKGLHFSSDAEVIAAAETWLDGQQSDFYFWVACQR